LEPSQVIIGKGTDHAFNTAPELLVEARELEDVNGWDELWDE